MLAQRSKPLLVHYRLITNGYIIAYYPKIFNLFMISQIAVFRPKNSKNGLYLHRNLFFFILKNDILKPLKDLGAIDIQIRSHFIVGDQFTDINIKFQ